MVFLCVSTISLANSKAEDKSRLRAPGYVIVSDEAKAEIPSNQVIVKGTVHSDSGFQGAIISTLDRQRVSHVDSLGQYKLHLVPSDTTIFFYRKGLTEEVIWSYEFKGGHEVVIDFYPQPTVLMMEVDKPVIYLYSDSPKTVKVKPEFKGQLTFTYPNLGEAWNVQTSANGRLMEASTGREFPYLFWEGESQELHYRTDEGKTPGFLIQTDSCVSFLENILSQLSLSPSEQTDFITFWGPRLIQSEYAFLQFLVDEEYEMISKNKVDPVPDVSRRVYLLFSSLNHPDDLQFEINPQSFEGVDRNGLVLIEWGGSKIPFISLKL